MALRFAKGKHGWVWNNLKTIKVVKIPKKEADFMGLVAAHQAAHGGTKTEAIQVIMNKFPAAHRKYLSKYNPHCKFLQD